MSPHPFILLAMILVGAYVTRLWLQDWRAARGGSPHPRALPGATDAPPRASLYAALGAILIVAAETAGESHLGLSAEQSEMTLLFGVYTLVAAVVEEIIFRGFLVIEGRGAAVRWTGVVAASLIFAGLHPFLWRWDDGAVVWKPGAKAVFSTTFVFVSSLWFYTVRFASWNPHRSLFPCFAAHVAKNLAVIAVKGMQGFVTGWY